MTTDTHSTFKLFSRLSIAVKPKRLHPRTWDTLGTSRGFIVPKKCNWRVLKCMPVRITVKLTENPWLHFGLIATKTPKVEWFERRKSCGRGREWGRGSGMRGCYHVSLNYCCTWSRSLATSQVSCVLRMHLFCSDLQLWNQQIITLTSFVLTAISRKKFSSDNTL